MLLRKHVKNGTFTVSEVQLFTKIPARFVPYILTDEFEQDFDTIHDAADGLNDKNA